MSKLEEARRLMEKNLKGLGSDRKNRIKTGKYIVLFNSLTMEEQRDTKKYFCPTFTILKPLCDGNNQDPSHPTYAGHHKGDVGSSRFNLGDTFGRFFGPFVCALMDIDPEEAKKLDHYECVEVAMSLLSDPSSGTEGAYNNRSIVEIKGVESAPYPDTKNPGKTKTSVNVFYNRNVKPSEIADSLSEKDIVRYFGSLENFAALVAAEG